MTTATIPLLLQEVPVDLATAGVPGAIAFIAPLTPEDRARWHNAFRATAEPDVQAAAVVKNHLLRIEGLGVRMGDTSIEPYDHRSLLHWRSLPPAVLRLLFAELVREPTAEVS